MGQNDELGDESENTPGWLKIGTANSTEVGAFYDDWAKTYDKTLEDWNYRAPTEAAASLAEKLKVGAEILDVGCGTGLFGKAMSEHLKCRVKGLDISAASLEIAAKYGCYDHLQRHDLQIVPLPVTENAFDAAGCIGVLTYIEDPADLLADLCRTVRQGGYIYFTQRDDRWVEKDCTSLISNFEKRGLWAPLMISEPRLILPKNEEVGDTSKVIHVLCRVA